MAKIIVLKGLPGSGKSTWAIDQVQQSKGKVKRVNKDDLRSMLDAGEWSKTNEQFVCSVRDVIIAKTLQCGHDIIIDDTNFNPRHEEVFHLFAEAYHATVEVKVFDTPLEECVRRDALRPNPVGRAVIERMHRENMKSAP